MTNPPKEWFEMPQLRRRRFADAVWIPLRALQTISEEGTPNTPGYVQEFFGAGAIAVPMSQCEKAEPLGWMQIGPIHHGGPHAFEDGSYKPFEVYQYTDGENLGIDLVVEQHFNSQHPKIWHLNQDLILALNLLQEGDSWLRPDEDYVEVIRQQRNADGTVRSIEIRSEFLRDYLAARGMALRLTTYRQRIAIFKDQPTHLTWPDKGLVEEQPHDRFKARVSEIDTDGGPFGGDVALFRAWRTDVDPEQDVPVFAEESDSNTASHSVTYRRRGPRFYRAEGELWREEWIEPAPRSERVRGDKPAESLSYAVDAAGKRMTSVELDDEDIGRYLWFDPAVINILTAKRGGGLRWHTRDTGSVSCSPDSSVHFGVNRLGLINVYARDIARQQLWRQRIWAGHNVAPDGQVCPELLAAQMEARPAATLAPESELARALGAVDAAFKQRTGTPLLRAHDTTDQILKSSHRFRATDQNGLFALAKDLARLTADRIDIEPLQTIAPPPAGVKWGSLKSLEKVLATILPADQARTALTPLAGAYELRLRDAHLPPGDVAEAFKMAGVDPNARPIDQGCQLLESVVSSLETIRAALTKPKPGVITRSGI
jgi:hypothetical protein